MNTLGALKQIPHYKLGYLTFRLNLKQTQNYVIHLKDHTLKNQQKLFKLVSEKWGIVVTNNCLSIHK